MARTAIPKTVRMQLLHKQNRTCFYCEQSIVDTFDVDHVIPVYQGGTNYIANLVASCVRCNRKKSCKTPDEYNAAKLAASKKRIQVIGRSLSLNAFETRYEPIGVSFKEYLSWNI